MPVESNIHFKEATAAVTNGLENGLEAAAEEERKNVEQNYDQNRDATGAPWKPLAEETTRKKGHSSILYERGDMRNAFYVRKTGPLSVAFGNSDPKIQWHERGTESIPARPVLTPAKTHLETQVLEDTVGREIRKQLALLKFRGMF